MSMIHTRDDGNGASRHFAVRDLRFAGTVAAGLVAGVLGVGALTAPLLGWTQWPDSPDQGAQAGVVTLHSRPSAAPVERPSTSAIGKGSSAVVPVVVPSIGLSGPGGSGLGSSGASLRLTLGRSGGAGSVVRTGAGGNAGSGGNGGGRRPGPFVPR